MLVCVTYRSVLLGWRAKQPEGSNRSCSCARCMGPVALDALLRARVLLFPFQGDGIARRREERQNQTRMLQR